MTIKDAKILLQDLENQKQKLTKELQDIDQTILALKLEVANYVLGEKDVFIEDEKVDDGKVNMVQIQFREGGKIYDYLWDEDETPNSHVYVPSRDGTYQEVKCLGLIRKEQVRGMTYQYAHNEDPYA